MSRQRPFTTELFGALVGQGLLDGIDRDGKPGTMPEARRFSSTTFQLTQRVGCLRQDQKQAVISESEDAPAPVFRVLMVDNVLDNAEAV